MSERDRDYDVVVAPPTFTVLTVIPYADEPEYREYTVPSDDLPMFLAEMADDQHAERVVTVERGDHDGDV
jgi:hypothetical protein